MKNKKFLYFYFLMFCPAIICPAKAAIDFNNPYVPTLDTLHAADSIIYPIDSGYSLTFSEVNSPVTNPKNYDFIYNIVNANSSLTPVYYKINTDATGGIGNNLPRITTVATNPSPVGYFKGLTLTSTTTGTSANRIYIVGGAISNETYTAIGLEEGKVMGDIVADFIGNGINVTHNYNDPYGGAIYSDGGTISSIVGDFNSNYLYSPSATGASNGGAIYVTGSTIGNITGNFIGNYISSIGNSSRGGAIYNAGTVGKLSEILLATNRHLKTWT